MGNDGSVVLKTLTTPEISILLKELGNYASMHLSERELKKIIATEDGSDEDGDEEESEEDNRDEEGSLDFTGGLKIETSLTNESGDGNAEAEISAGDSAIEESDGSAAEAAQEESVNDNQGLN